MKVLRVPEEFQSAGSLVFAAVGVFDGLHLGHQQILNGLIEEAKASGGISLVVTFDRHPNAVVAPDRSPPLIYPLDKRLEVIRQLAPNALWLIRFDEAFSKKNGSEFVAELATHFSPLASIWVGSDFQFGHKRSGNVALLRESGARLKFNVHAEPPLLAHDEAISSTRIREKIMAGDLDAASEMLGRPYALCGRVIRGDHIGRTLGFPTANLDSRGLATPPPGVYAVRARHGSKAHPGVMNIGLRPTLANPSRELRCEVHLLDFSGDLYGIEIEVDLLAKLREEQHFPGVDALRNQIAADIVAARHILALS